MYIMYLIQGTMVEQLCLNGLPCINIFVIKNKMKKKKKKNSW